MYDSLVSAFYEFNKQAQSSPTDFGIVFAFIHVLAFLFSVLRAKKHSETVTNCITIFIITLKDITTLCLWFAVAAYTSDVTPTENIEKIYSAQHVYLAFAAMNLLAFILLRRIHFAKSYVLGSMYFKQRVVIFLLFLLHLMLWFKLRVFNSYYEHEYLNVLYWLGTLFLTSIQAILMFIPEVSMIKDRITKFYKERVS